MGRRSLQAAFAFGRSASGETQHHEAGPEGPASCGRVECNGSVAAAGRPPPDDEVAYWVTYQSATFQVGPIDDGLPVKFWTFGLTTQTSSR